MSRHLEVSPAMARYATLGFTLVELLIALAIGLIVMGSIYSVCITQQQSYRRQQLNMEIRQNLRSAMIILEQEIRLAGYDPQESGIFGIVDIRRYDLVESGEVNPAGQPALFYTLDMDENGALDNRNGSRNREHPNFRIRHDQNLDRRYLAWDVGGGRQPLSENINAVGFAYAVDADRDGRLDLWKDGHHIIWAVDTDNDNLLDARLDTNNDGRIDENDDSNADGTIDAADGGLLDPPIKVDRIGAVRIWLLAVSSYSLRGHHHSGKLVVGDRLISADTDGRVYKVLESTVYCRNLL